MVDNSESDSETDRIKAKKKLGNLPLEVITTPAPQRGEQRSGLSSVGKGDPPSVSSTGGNPLSMKEKMAKI